MGYGYDDWRWERTITPPFSGSMGGGVQGPLRAAACISYLYPPPISEVSGSATASTPLEYLHHHKAQNLSCFLPMIGLSRSHLYPHVTTCFNIDVCDFHA